MSFVKDMFRKFGFAFCVSEIFPIFFESCVEFSVGSSYTKFKFLFKNFTACTISYPCIYYVIPSKHLNWIVQYFCSLQCILLGISLSLILSTCPIHSQNFCNVIISGDLFSYVINCGILYITLHLHIGYLSFYFGIILLSKVFKC